MILAITLALTLQDIGWLAGEWQLTNGATCIEELWTGPSNNLMVGMSRTVANGRTIAFEFVRIEARGDGIFYVAQPGGKPPVDFTLASDSASELIFVNPGHADHLTRVVYRRGADANLTARIEGENNGKAFSEDYAYSRRPANGARCGAQ